MRDFAKQLVSQFNSDTDSTDNYFRVFTLESEILVFLNLQLKISDLLLKIIMRLAYLKLQVITLNI